MMCDLIEIKPKINKKKVIIAVIIVLIFILLLSIPIIKHIKEKNKNNTPINNEEDSASQEVLEETSKKEKEKHIPQINMTPVYSEEAKNEIHNIYHSEEKVVYLTFDDGPSKTVTPLILDLLKQENIENEKMKEYINVLDNKSQRLKKLIEDLVEASKASSGNIKLS